VAPVLKSGEQLMGFVLLGVALIVMKYTDVSPVAAWSWLWVLSPFGLAVAWWGFSDASGRTARLQSEKVDNKARARKSQAMEALGISKQAIAAHEAAERSRKAAGRPASR
jgi:small Trp-rich protein